MTNLAYALILSSALAASYSPAGASVPPASTQEQTPESLLRSGIENLLRALGPALDSLPQYEMPQINEYGDIVIRRINPAKPRPVPPQVEMPRRL